MKTKNELIEFIKRQIKVENDIVDSLNKALIDMTNLPVKGVLKEILSNQ